MEVERSGVERADPTRNDVVPPLLPRVRRPAKWNKSSQRYGPDNGRGIALDPHKDVLS